jgi:uncharacterized protein YjbJ (UPF0337 family)
MGGTMDKIKGSVKETVGAATGDRRTEAEGRTDQLKGDVKNLGSDARDTAKGVRDSLEKR